MRNLERVLKALANKRRLEILKYLKREGEAFVGDIAEAIHLSFKATSRHLSILVAADILEREQRSLRIFYSLANPLHPTVKSILNLL